MRKTMKSRKAISPILATLLLIVIAVAAIVVTYAWIMTYIGGAANQASVVLYKSNIYWNGTEQKTYVTIGNSGTGSGRITTLYLGASNNVLNITGSTDIGSGVVVNAKSTVVILISWPNDLANTWTAGEYYYFKVVTDTGLELGPFPEQASE